MPTTIASKIWHDSRKAGAMHELLAPCALIGDSVLTKRGDLFTVLRISPVDPECLEPDAVAAICHRFDAVLRALGPEYRIYQYLFRRDRPELSRPMSQEPLCEGRAQWLERRRAELYSISLFLVILRMRSAEQQGGNLASVLSMRRTLEVSQSALRRDSDALSTAVGSICVQLERLLRPQRLDRAETLAFLRQLVNTTSYKADVHGSVQDFHLDQQMAASTLECWPRYLRQDDYFIRLLSMTEPPAQTFPHLLRGLLSVPCNLTLCSEWKREPNQTVRREIDKRRRHYHLAKTSMLSYVGNTNPRPDEVLVDDSRTAVVEELNNALREMEVNENYFGRF